MTSVQQLSERLKRGFGIEIVEFHRINRKAIDRFSWWAFCKAGNTDMSVTLGSYYTVKQLLKAETLFLLKDRQVAPAPIIRDGTGWIEERRDEDAESAVRLPDAPTCSRYDT